MKKNNLFAKIFKYSHLFLLFLFFSCFFGCRKDTDSQKSTTPNDIVTPTPQSQMPTDKEVKMKYPKTVLTSSLAGTWYPADENALRRQIEKYINEAEATTYNNIIAVILPHAGYQYSGPAAAAALKSLQNKNFQRVIIIGPSHQLPMHEVLSIPNVTHYQTPLGQVPLDKEFIEQLSKHDQFQTITPTHEHEHSVQIQIPLLQYVIEDFKLVPIISGSLSRDTIAEVAAILNSLIDEKTLMVASSDFTHYGSRFDYVPFRDDIPQNLKKLDMGAYEFIEQHDVEGFLAYRSETGATICGFIPIAILMSMLPSDTKTHLARYETSGEQSGNFVDSVSYLSIVFTGKWSRGPAVAPSSQMPLTDEDKKILLQLARQSFTNYVRQGKVQMPEELGITITEPLKQVRATFVTLKRDHMLRGCIGEIYPSQPLYQSVLINAINSAATDRRFLPVSASECDQLSVEISVLTPPTAVDRYQDIKIGRHGIIMSKSGLSAVFLPQVAPEQGWNLEQTLTELSRKAGLPDDAWKEGAQFMTFEAVVFGEEQKFEQIN